MTSIKAEGSNVEIQFPASPARLGDLRQTVRSGLRGQIRDDDLDDLLLALHEATTNAVLHGSEGGSAVDVAVHLEDGWAEATVLDRGSSQSANPDRDEEEQLSGSEEPLLSGRGLWLMGRLVDEVRLERVAPRGTRVTLRRRIRIEA
jgi:anti-sigma regulatory factor (Ser/Thr protein kinase)